MKDTFGDDLVKSIIWTISMSLSDKYPWSLETPELFEVLLLSAIEVISLDGVDLGTGVLRRESTSGNLLDREIEPILDRLESALVKAIFEIPSSFGVATVIA